MKTMAEVLAGRTFAGRQLNERQVEEIADALAAAGYGPVKAAQSEVEAAVYPLIRDLIDPEECWFDHHGGCQAHGYLSLKPGEICPQAAAKAWIAAPAAEEA
ncbi:MAG: hypothetical protein M3536_09265 [Actinomycetota bacterium]|nr:hypothetical protein [Actinomycetota bacterium]